MCLALRHWAPLYTLFYTTTKTKIELLYGGPLTKSFKTDWELEYGQKIDFGSKFYKMNNWMTFSFISKETNKKSSNNNSWEILTVFLTFV